MTMTVETVDPEVAERAQAGSADVDAGPGRARGRTDRAPLPPLPAALGVTIWVLAALGALAAWTLTYALGLSAVQEQRSQQQLYAQFREALTPANGAPVGGAIEPGTPVALMQIPAAGLHDVMVVEGTASGDLRQGPGHRRDTPLPGQSGVSVLMGRSSTYGAPFRAIATLQPGDSVSFLTGQGTFQYRVIDVRRAGDPLPPPVQQGASRVVLVTSEGSGWQAGWAPDRVVYVDARLVLADLGTGQPTSTAASAPPGRPGAVPEAEQAMQIDPSALFGLVLWLQALILVAVAVAWGRGSWGRWHTWIVGLPTVLAVVWAATDCAMRLLPNLL